MYNRRSYGVEAIGDSTDTDSSRAGRTLRSTDNILNKQVQKKKNFKVTFI